ncbi:MAG: hypothetical protein OIF48_17820 [Silicimonas sp.]|nr:hypothetical protein [Silicimonas sp.]
MLLCAIAIIEFDDITPGGQPRPLCGVIGAARPYLISTQASLIPIFVEDEDGSFETWRRDPRGVCRGQIAEPVVVNGTSYGPATACGAPTDRIALQSAFVTTAGETYFVVRISGRNVGITGPRLPRPGQHFTIADPPIRLHS